jgi:hypothetical protein
VRTRNIPADPQDFFKNRSTPTDKQDFRWVYFRRFQRTNPSKGFIGILSESGRFSSKVTRRTPKQHPISRFERLYEVRENANGVNFLLFRGVMVLLARRLLEYAYGCQEAV